MSDAPPKFSEFQFRRLRRVIRAWAGIWVAAVAGLVFAVMIGEAWIGPALIVVIALFPGVTNLRLARCEYFEALQQIENEASKRKREERPMSLPTTTIVSLFFGGWAGVMLLAYAAYPSWLFLFAGVGSAALTAIVVGARFAHRRRSLGDVRL